MPWIENGELCAATMVKLLYLRLHSSGYPLHGCVLVGLAAVDDEAPVALEEFPTLALSRVCVALVVVMVVPFVVIVSF